jgi:hypothetical protein
VKGSSNAFTGPGSSTFVPDHLPHQSVLAQDMLCVRVQTQYGNQSLAGKPYQLQVNGKSHEGSLGSDGAIYVEVSRQAEKGILTVWPFGKNNPPWQWNLDIKQQTRTTEVNGIQSRLKNLGFYSGALDGKYGKKSQAALRRFQYIKRIPATSELTSDTLSLLCNKHDI